MAEQFACASRWDGLRFTALVVLPNVIQGRFRRRRWATRLGTTADVDGRAIRFLEGLRRRLGRGAIWVRVGGEEALFVQDAAEIRRVLGGSPYPFASDPRPKRVGMSHFQPDALTISRGDLWQNRRRFTESVLDSAQPVHRLADSFARTAREEMDALIDHARTAGLGWDEFHASFGRITRRIILGDSAREDYEVSELLARLMVEANVLPKAGSVNLERLLTRIREYVGKAERGSLVSLFGEAPWTPETRIEGQVPHWMFAMHDTLAANVFRALALIVTHSRQRMEVENELAKAGGDLMMATEVDSLTYLSGCLQDTMRLYPTTPMLSRETVTTTAWDSQFVPAGTIVLISNTFDHRDRLRHEYADRFAPEVWTEGPATEDWSFNHFSHGPQICPGAGLAIFIGKAVLASILAPRTIQLLRPKLNSERPLPRMLDYFRFRFQVGTSK
jgi:cytochrome P450